MNIKALFLALCMAAGTIMPAVYAVAQDVAIVATVVPNDAQTNNADNEQSSVTAQPVKKQYDDLFDEALDWVVRKLTPYWQNKKIQYAVYAGGAVAAYILIAAIVNPWIGKAGANILDTPKAQKSIQDTFTNALLAGLKDPANKEAAKDFVLDILKGPETQEVLQKTADDILKSVEENVSDISYNSGAEFINGALDTLIARINFWSKLNCKAVELDEFILGVAS